MRNEKNIPRGQGIALSLLLFSAQQTKTLENPYHFLQFNSLPALRIRTLINFAQLISSVKTVSVVQSWDFPMASATATWSPGSLQLRLALSCRKSPEILVRMRVAKLSRRFRLLCVAQDEARSGNGLGRRRDGALRVRSDSTVDGFSGWSETDGKEEPVESQRKKWFEGNDSFGCVFAFNLIISV